MIYLKKIGHDVATSAELVTSSETDIFATLSPGQTNSQVDASFLLAFCLYNSFAWTCTDLFSRKATHVCYHLATQRKSTQIVSRHLYVPEIWAFCVFFEIVSPLANPFGHPSQVPMQVRP